MGTSRFPQRVRLGYSALAVLVAVATTGAGQELPAPKPKPTPRPTSPDTKRTRQPERSATLLIKADVACTVRVDGRPVGSLAANAPIQVPVSLGKHLVDATSEEGKITWEQVVDLKAPGQEIVLIELASKVAAGRATPDSSRSAAPLPILAVIDLHRVSQESSLGKTYAAQLEALGKGSEHYDKAQALNFDFQAQDKADDRANGPPTLAPGGA